MKINLKLDTEDPNDIRTAEAILKTVKNCNFEMAKGNHSKNEQTFALPTGSSYNSQTSQDARSSRRKGLATEKQKELIKKMEQDPDRKDRMDQYSKMNGIDREHLTNAQANELIKSGKQQIP